MKAALVLLALVACVSAQGVSVSAPGTTVAVNGQGGTLVRAPAGVTVDAPPQGPPQTRSERPAPQQAVTNTGTVARGAPQGAAPGVTTVNAPGTQVVATRSGATVAAPGTTVVGTAAGTTVSAPGTRVVATPAVTAVSAPTTNVAVDNDSGAVDVQGAWGSVTRGPGGVSVNVPFFSGTFPGRRMLRA